MGIALSCRTCCLLRWHIYNPNVGYYHPIIFVTLYILRGVTRWRTRRCPVFEAIIE